MRRLRGRGDRKTWPDRLCGLPDVAAAARFPDMLRRASKGRRRHIRRGVSNRGNIRRLRSPHMGRCTAWVLDRQPVAPITIHSHLIFFRVQGNAAGLRAKLDEVARYEVFKAENARDAIADADHRPVSATFATLATDCRRKPTNADRRCSQGQPERRASSPKVSVVHVVRFSLSIFG